MDLLCRCDICIEMVHIGVDLLSKRVRAPQAIMNLVVPPGKLSSLRVITTFTLYCGASCCIFWLICSVRSFSFILQSLLAAPGSLSTMVSINNNSNGIVVCCGVNECLPPLADRCAYNATVQKRSAKTGRAIRRLL